MVTKTGVGGHKPALIPPCITLRAEEIGPHVVVNSVHLPTAPAEIIYDLRADETRGTGDQQFFSTHRIIFIWVLIFEAVIDVFDDLVLKGQDPLIAAPPITIIVV